VPEPTRTWQPPAGYFDAASAEPPPVSVPAVLAAAAEAGWADPGRRYRLGRRAAVLQETARESLADFLGCATGELIIVPSATVAAAAALRGTVSARRRRGIPPRMVLSAVEQSGVLAEAGRLVLDTGADLATVAVDATGRVDAADFIAAARGAAVAVLQAANPEVGTLQPLAAVAPACADAGVPLLVDATASTGRSALPAQWGGCWADPRQWGGLPGLGLLALRTAVDPVLAPDRFEQGAWPGPVPLPALVAAAAAAESLTADRAVAAAEDQRLAGLVDRLRIELPRLIPECEVLGDPTRRLPHLLTVSFLYVAGEELLDELDRRGFAAASGSACASDNREVAPSHVLTAMGALTGGSLRLSLPRGVAEADVDRLLAELPDVVTHLRRGRGAADL
jgi:cysteine desulfurase